MYETVSVTNVWSKVYTHIFNEPDQVSADGTILSRGQRREYKINPGETIIVPEIVGKDIAYHLAQRVLNERGLGFWGSDMDAVKSWILGGSSPFAEAEVVEVVEQKEETLEEVIAPKRGRKPKAETAA